MRDPKGLALKFYVRVKSHSSVPLPFIFLHMGQCVASIGLGKYFISPLKFFVGQTKE